jgi:hypothetical protein
MYKARGIPEGPDDGTLAPGAVAASLPFAPEFVADTLRELVRAYPNLRSEYGLRASLNPTIRRLGQPLELRFGSGSDRHDDREPPDRSGVEAHAAIPVHLARIAEGGFHRRMARIRRRTAVSEGR